MYVRYDLPREIKKEDVVEVNGMEIAYDAEKAIYFLFTWLDLESQATKNFKVTVLDIWKIPDTQTDFIKDQIGLYMKNAKKDEHIENEKLFSEKLEKQIEQILAEQEVKKGDLNKRVNSYRAGLEQLEDMKAKLISADDFAQEADRYVEIIKNDKRIRYVLEAKNDEKEGLPKEVEITQYLPEGIRPEQLLDGQGFDVIYDPNIKRYYVTNKVSLKPGESKTFSLVILDIWYISDSRLDQYQKKAEKLGFDLSKTSYSKPAAFNVAEVKRLVAEIKESQVKAVQPDDKVATYAVNLGRIKTIQEKIDQLKKMKEEDVASVKSKSIMNVVRSVTPDVSTTWMLIYITIGFLAFVSLLLYILWWGQTKAKQSHDKNLETGTFADVNEPNKEEKKT